jgi:hypothetical protein
MVNGERRIAISHPFMQEQANSLSIFHKVLFQLQSVRNGSGTNQLGWISTDVGA